jgi:hypothetical protein
MAFQLCELSTSRHDYSLLFFGLFFRLLCLYFSSFTYILLCGFHRVNAVTYALISGPHTRLPWIAHTHFIFTISSVFLNLVPFLARPSSYQRNA